LIPALAILLLADAPPKAIRWERSLSEAFQKARTAHKPVMLDFFAEWCALCHRLDQTTYTDVEVLRLSQDFVAVKIDASGGEKSREVITRYEVSAVPTLAFVSPSGRLLLKVGYQGPGEFPDTLHQALEAGRRVMGWESSLERDPQDPSALAGLGLHLFDQDRYDESREFLLKARDVDRARPSIERKKTRTHLALLYSWERQYPDAEGMLKEALSLEPTGDYDAQILFLLGKNYMKLGRPGDAKAAFQKILDTHAESPVAQRAWDTLAALDKKH
jgi:thiol-disulfide isomerase/thioredoxin